MIGGRRVLVLALASLSVSISACTTIDRGAHPLDIPDETAYSRWVHPYVELRCGSLDCHGDKGRPFRLYGGGGLRLRAELRGTFVAPEEIMANVRSFAGISPDIARVSEHRALLAGLAVYAGGLSHVGGDVWDSTNAPGYRCIFAWLEGQSDNVDAQTACMEAFDSVDHSQ